MRLSKWKGMELRRKGEGMMLRRWAGGVEKGERKVHEKIAVIGAGVVGISVARCFALRGFDVVLIERSDTVLDSPASAGHAGILCSGFDAKFKSIEKKCLRNGRKLLEGLMEVVDSDLPVEKRGAIMVAWNEEELKQLSVIKIRAIENKVQNIKSLSPEEVKKLEPKLADYLDIKGGLFIPDEWVADPWFLPAFYLANALQLGVDLKLSHVVNDLSFDEDLDEWHIECKKKGKSVTFTVDYVVNCAGLYSDYVQEMLSGDESPFITKPKKGQFLVANTDQQLLQHIILSPPLEDTKGLILWNSYYGHLMIGPTFEEQTDRDNATVTEEKQAFLSEQLGIMIEGVEAHITDKIMYGGIRPATQNKDYQIMGDDQRKYLTVGGIRSTGFSASLGIAEYVYNVWTKFYAKKSFDVLSTNEDVKKSLAELKKSVKNMKTVKDNNEIILYGHKLRVTHPLSKYAIKTGKFFDKQNTD